jgi:hypothetical protein
VRPLSVWRRVLSAWALVAIFAVSGFAVVELAPSLGLAEARPELQGARIPQGTRTPQSDPFDIGPPMFEHADGAWDAESDWIVKR